MDIFEKDLKLVKSILNKHLLDCEVWAFGSRVNGTARSYSDFDLVIVGEGKVPLNTIFALKEEFQESDLNFRVDVLDWNRISDSFRKIIKENYVKIL